MNKEQIRKFVDFVDSGAPLKSYTKALGLSFHEYKYHLTKLHEYRELLDEKEKPKAPQPGRLFSKKKVTKEEDEKDSCSEQEECDTGEDVKELDVKKDEEDE